MLRVYESNKMDATGSIKYPTFPEPALIESKFLVCSSQNLVATLYVISALVHEITNAIITIPRSEKVILELAGIEKKTIGATKKKINDAIDSLSTFSVLPATNPITTLSNIEIILKKIAPKTDIDFMFYNTSIIYALNYFVNDEPIIHL